MYLLYYEMGATPDRPRPKPTLICHIQTGIKLNLDSTLTYHF